ncbi:galactokinase [Flavobacteriaceae bacterium F08102]|nr:galactokinase [Flavobacteriaceae bacterium F08102]
MKDLQSSASYASTSINKKKIVVRAPARTCLFGDHQDYLGLPIIACAISRYIILNAIENESAIFQIDLPDIGEKRDIDIYSLDAHIVKGDNFLAALKILRHHGCIPNKGFDVSISGNIPINEGTSSSSAVVIAWVRFLLDAFGCDVDVTSAFVSQIAFEAEVVEHGFLGGRMDQFSIGLGNILFLETGTNFTYEVLQKPLPGLIIGESGIAKKTNETFEELKKGAWDAIDFLKKIHPFFEINAVKPHQVKRYLKDLPDTLQPYFYAAVNNHDLTKCALVELKKNGLDLPKIGTLMTEHHNILKNILRISMPKIDSMIDGALKAGAYGAKIVGSGSGGSIVAIAPEDKIDLVIDGIKRAGGKDAYLVSVDSGVTTLEN